MGNVATMVQDDNTFTFTPSTDASNAGSFNVTFRATDGTNVTDAISSFDLLFTPAIANVTGVLFTQTSYDYNHTVFEYLIIDDGYNNLMDDPSFRDETTLPTADWYSDFAETQTSYGYYSTYFYNNLQSQFSLTLNPQYYRGSYGTSPTNQSMSVTWTTPRNISGVLVSGDYGNGYEYWTGGYMQFYINGVLDSTQYQLQGLNALWKAS